MPLSEGKSKGVIYGRSLDFRPLPPSAEMLANAIRLNNINYVQLPQKNWRDKLRLTLQAAGLAMVPGVVRLRWQARDIIETLQASLLGRGRGRRTGISHPIQLLPAIEFMMTLSGELTPERRIIQGLVGAALAEYRTRINLGRERPMTFAKEATHHFYAGYKEQQLLNRGGSPAEQFRTIQRIYTSYYFFRVNYIFAIIAREPPESGTKLFSKFMRVVFFLSTIQDDGTIAPKPAYRQLPPKEHVVFLARRDMALQARLREDEGLRAELQNLLRYFRSVR